MSEPASNLTRLADRRPRSVRRILKEWLDEQLATESEPQTKELVNRALERFTTDSEFAAAAVRDSIHQVVPKLLGEEFRTRRQRWVVTAAGAISRKRLEDTARDRWSRVHENVNGKYLAILDMTRPEMITAAEARQSRVDGENRWIELLRDTAARMPDDETTPGEYLSDKDLADLIEKHFKS